MAPINRGEGYIMPGLGHAADEGALLRGDSGSGGGVRPERGGRSASMTDARAERLASPVEEGLAVELALLSEATLLSQERLPPDTLFRLERSYTLEAFDGLRARLKAEGRPVFRLEFLDGDVFVTTTAKEPHAIAISNLMVALTLTVRRKKLGTVYTDFTMVLDPNAELVPDLIVMFEQDLPRIGPRGLMGPAGIVVEVLSPSTARYDRNRKLQRYLSAGVREYWLVNTDRLEVEIFTAAHLDPAQREKHPIIRGEELLTSPQLPGWKLELAGIFDRMYVHQDPEAQEIAAAFEAQLQSHRHHLDQMKVRLVHEQTMREQAQAFARSQASLLSLQGEDFECSLTAWMIERRRLRAARRHERSVAARLAQEQAEREAVAARLAQEQATRFTLEQQLQALQAELVRLRGP